MLFSSTQKFSRDYSYLGIEKGVKKSIEWYGIKNFANNIKLNVSVDAGSLFKSSNGELWPILGMVHAFLPFIIALYFGSIKPNEADEFIQDFMEE